MKDRIQQLAYLAKDDVIAIRRTLHQNPELSFKEFNTAAFIKTTLTKMGVPWVPIAGTGVLGTIQGRSTQGKVIALRADIDALPIQEETGLDFQSTIPGVMHACGHDMHTASLLGTAHILNQLKDRFNGTLKLIFQPGEEILPGGATKILEENGLSNPQVEIILGQHVMPSLESGKVALRGGTMMAAMDEIRITIHGKGGHGALPHENRDPVVAAATLITTLQQVISRHGDPRVPSVLSFGKVEADGAINIIPNSVYMEGTFRTFNEAWRDKAHALIKEMTTSIASALQCTCEVDIRKGYPALHNDEELTTRIQSLMHEFVGPQNVIDANIMMASDDFAYYGRHARGCYYMLGTAFSEKPAGTLHTPTLELNEDALELGMGLMSYLAVSSLMEK